MKNTEASVEEIYELWKQGYTYQDLSRHYKRPWNTIRARLLSYAHDNGLPVYHGIPRHWEIIYPNIIRWMLDNKMGIMELSMVCGLSNKTSNEIRFRLSGKRDFNISEIRLLLAASKKSFEWLFKQREPAQEEEVHPYEKNGKKRRGNEKQRKQPGNV